MGKKALVLGGGAPNYTLMTGALLAFEQAGVHFDVVSMAGGGAVVGLTYLAPKGMSRIDALKNSVNLGVSDAIHQLIPMNYKVFTKGGPGADAFRNVLQGFPGYDLLTNQYQMNSSQKLASDFIQAVWTMMAPLKISTKSTGLCAHAPFVEDLVDFDKLSQQDTDYYLNAYCLTDQKMVIFDRNEIDARHLKASLLYPFIYPPFPLDDKLYIEGASRDTFNFKALVERETDIDTIVVFNAVGIDGLLHPPKSMWDAYGQQMITPLVALAQADLRLFEEVDNKGPNKARLLKVPFDIPEKYMAEALTWSRTNLERLFLVGYEAGQKFVQRHGATLDRD
jgi:NTE family protein